MRALLMLTAVHLAACGGEETPHMLDNASAYGTANVTVHRDGSTGSLGFISARADFDVIDYGDEEPANVRGSLWGETQSPFDDDAEAYLDCSFESNEETGGIDNGWCEILDNGSDAGDIYLVDLIGTISVAEPAVTITLAGTWQGQTGTAGTTDLSFTGSLD